jgi:hypothetical protein
MLNINGENGLKGTGSQGSDQDSSCVQVEKKLSYRLTKNRETSIKGQCDKL